MIYLLYASGKYHSAEDDLIILRERAQRLHCPCEILGYEPSDGEAGPPTLIETVGVVAVERGQVWTYTAPERAYRKMVVKRIIDAMVFYMDVYETNVGPVIGYRLASLIQWELDHLKGVIQLVRRNSL